MTQGNATLARRLDFTPARLTSLARASRRMNAPFKYRTRALSLSLLGGPLLGALLAAGGATFLTIRVHVAFAAPAVVFGMLFLLIGLAFLRFLRQRASVPCATGEAAVDDGGLHWRFDDGAEIDLDWPGVAAWATDADSIYVLDAIGTANLVPSEGEGDPVRAMFAERCPEARRVALT